MLASDNPYYQELSTDDIIELAAVDSVFFSQTFFPKTFRQETPNFHRKVWDLLDSPEDQYVGLEMFRGSGKTTLCRANVAKRIAYGISRTILFVSASQGHAVRSVRWIKRQVENQTEWARTFGLHKGKKWADEEIEIINEVVGCSIFVLAAGITGQIRGVNLEDYRPDFIIVDDPCDEENTGTAEQLAKTEGLFFGALAPGLAPRSEMPWSKMALLQTGLDKQDLINKAHTDGEWKTVKFGILDYDDKGNPSSTWKERWTTEEVLEKKKHYLNRGQSHYWYREYECKIIAPEEAPLKMEWLKYWDEELKPLPQSMLIYFGIDPARAKSTNPHKTCIVSIGIHGNDVYLLDTFEQESLNPEEIWTHLYGMVLHRRPYQTGVETIAYQQTLKWYIERKMKEVGHFFQIIGIEDRRKKGDRILQEITDRAAGGHLYVNAERHGKWIEYYRNWRWGKDIDLLDATALALMQATGSLFFGASDDSYERLLNEDNIPDKPEAVYACP